MMTIEEYRAAILKALLDAKNEDGTPAITAKEAEEALRGFTDDELNDGILGTHQKTLLPSSSKEYRPSG